jgi:hypothetical protein
MKTILDSSHELKLVIDQVPTFQISKPWLISIQYFYCFDAPTIIYLKLTSWLD